MHLIIRVSYINALRTRNIINFVQSQMKFPPSVYYQFLLCILVHSISSRRDDFNCVKDGISSITLCSRKEKLFENLDSLEQSKSIKYIEDFCLFFPNRANETSCFREIYECHPTMNEPCNFRRIFEIN